LLVPFPPGGNADFLRRLIGDSISQTFGKPVVIDNRPGANSHIAMHAMLREPADGYTLMLSGVNSVVTNLLSMPTSPDYLEARATFAERRPPKFTR
jgi:tripartite-type tricarboxylate transporter receptor subunit TctC